MTNPPPGSPAGHADRLRAEAMLRFLMPQAGPGETWGMVIPTVPHSKSRPRFSPEGRAYKDPADAAAEDLTKWHLRRRYRGRPMTGNVALGAVFYRPNRQVIDSDNMVKHLCDAGNGILWVDDSQVTAQLGVIELDSNKPRTVLVVGPHASTMLRGSDYDRPCEHCGIPFTPFRQVQRFCSRDCSGNVQTAGRS